MTRRAQPLPTMQEVLDYLQNHENLSKRQISRDFHIKGDGHIYLKQLLKEIERKGLLVRQGRRYALKDRLPSHTDVVVVGIDQDGCLLARPVQWTADSPEPTIFITRYQRLHPTPTIGDMLAVKIQPTSKTTYEGEAVRAISAQGSQMVGVWFKGRVLSVDRRFQQAFIPDGAFPPDMKDNDLVEVAVSQTPRPTSVPSMAKASSITKPLANTPTALTRWKAASATNGASTGLGPSLPRPNRRNVR